MLELLLELLPELLLGEGVGCFACACGEGAFCGEGDACFTCACGEGDACFTCGCDCLACGEGDGCFACACGEGDGCDFFACACGEGDGCDCFACACGEGDDCFACACGEGEAEGTCGDLLLEFELLKDVGLYVVLPDFISSNNCKNPWGSSVNSSGIQNPIFFLLIPVFVCSVAQTLNPGWCFEL